MGKSPHVESPYFPLTFTRDLIPYVRAEIMYGQK